MIFLDLMDPGSCHLEACQTYTCMDIHDSICSNSRKKVTEDARQAQHASNSWNISLEVTQSSVPMRSRKIIEFQQLSNQAYQTIALWGCLVRKPTLLLPIRLHSSRSMMLLIWTLSLLSKVPIHLYSQLHTVSSGGTSSTFPSAQGAIGCSTIQCMPCIFIF